MATPIKSTNASGGTPAVSGVSPAVSDLLARYGSQQGGDGQNQSFAFSQWMDKHTAVPSATTTDKPASEPAPKAPSSQALNDSAKMAEQALARTRQQAMLANKQLEANKASQSVQRQDDADDKAASAAASQKGSTTKTNRGGQASDKTESKDKNDDDKDEVKFSTTTGDGSAVVRELTPPSTIQPGDSAGMMAWLASLTHGDLAHGKGGAVADKDGGLSASTNGTAALQGGTDGRLQDAGLTDVKAGSQGALLLDNAMWQGAAGANANLQVDALLGQSAKGGDARTELDPLAGLMAGGVKGASFGQSLSEASATARHESATLSTPVDSPDFAQALADKVSMWVGSARGDGPMTAELHLNPAEMGPINVKISLDGQNAQVDFAAAALETRKAIEASLPMLSSALSGVGLNMTGGDVSSQTAQQQFNQGSAQSQGGSGRAIGASGGSDADAGSEPVGMRAVAAPRPGRLGGLDLYA
ncbi:MAG: flagellar hook-length control protein FliK [Burkholderiales bacterium]|nr:MAG: flagellar hook-length control protein FliK [Burkholderiales bacterium]